MLCVVFADLVVLVVLALVLDGKSGLRALTSWIWKWASFDDVAQFAAKVGFPLELWNQTWSGARVLERRGGFRALRSHIVGWVVGMGTGGLAT